MSPARGGDPGRERGLNRGHPRRSEVASEHDGRELLEYLTAEFPAADRARWGRRIDRGEVSVDGRAAAREQPLNAGAVVVWRRPPWREPAVPLGFAVLFRDDDLLAVGKPRGLPTLPGGGRFQEHTLLHQVRRLDPEAAPAHRLGTGTSGVVLFGRTLAARRDLAEQFRARTVRRIYRGLVDNRSGRARDTVIDAPIGPVPHARLGQIMGACPDGKDASSRIRVLEKRGELALVEVEIATGRAHQIRIHLALAQTPLVGERLFGEQGRPVSDALPSESGYSLHAEKLMFRHPSNAAGVRVVCPPPPALRQSAPNSPRSNLPWS